jgi:hypothetical protein
LGSGTACGGALDLFSQVPKALQLRGGRPWWGYKSNTTPKNPITRSGWAGLYLLGQVSYLPLRGLGGPGVPLEGFPHLKKKEYIQYCHLNFFFAFFFIVYTFFLSLSRFFLAFKGLSKYLYIFGKKFECKELKKESD